MNRELPAGALTMACPRCHHAEVVAEPDSSRVIAWFTCPACGCDWSARLRNGRPDEEVFIPVPDEPLRRAG